MPSFGNIYTHMSSDYKKYLVRQMGLKEAQFVPFVREDEHPDIDPDELRKGTGEERREHGMSPKKARKTATDHLEEPNQGHYYSGVEKAKKAGMLKDQTMLSPTAKAPQILAIGIRGSSTGGLPSGADQTPDLAPHKLGGYDRVAPEDLNTTLVDKTPANPEIKQETNPINQNPATGQGVTHPHQIQVTAGEEPQSTTGASTDSDPTLKLKSAMPKGIDIDITEKEEEPHHEEENPMIPVTSLSETFERHKKLAMEIVKRHQQVHECATCGCGDPHDKHEVKETSDEDPNKKTYGHLFRLKKMLAKTPEGPKKDQLKAEYEKKMKELKEGTEKKARTCYHCKQPHPCACDKKDEEDAKLQRDNPEAYRKKFGMKVDKRSDLNESYTAPFQRMRAMAGLGPVILGKDGQWVDTTITEAHPPGASHPFVTHWKMDKEKAGYVKVDENKLNAVKAQLEKKSKRGTLSDKELLLTKRIAEVLQKRTQK